ncbi:MAG: glycogen synthase GlgA [Gammaproteobacteria bacterium]|nr:glycogen synthase GlgA [Gammaproteobacteria bacterium]
MRILLTASEVFPLAKTGGLADAVAGLAAALAELGHEVRVAVPAYPGVVERSGALRRLGAITAAGQPFEIYAGRVAGLPPLWLFANAALFERPGDLYHDEHGQPFADNALRFGSFCQALAQACASPPEAAFQPQLVHANDWQTALTLPWLQTLTPTVARVYTIHNLAYQGVFPAAVAHELGLPATWWHAGGVEFYGQLSFMKAGIVHAQRLTTVSPTYAREILTPACGHGLDGLLRTRAAVLSGILNGIDEATWNPATDPHLRRRYRAHDITEGKRSNRRALQHELGLAAGDAPFLIGSVTRLAYQKGMDLLVAAMPELMQMPVQIALLGAGDRSLAEEFTALCGRWHGRFAFHYGYSEDLAHRIEAGADGFLMPSRYEPCGLNQIYSQRYGTVPIVRRIGGLADTVVDADGATLAAGTATGIHFLDADPGGLLYGVRRALELRSDASIWVQLQRNGMHRDFSWRAAAQRYLAVYAQALAAAV